MGTTTEQSTNGTNGTGTQRTVTLATGHDHGLVVAALEERKDKLDGLAKKTEEAGYAREARAIRGDAATIQRTILPAFQSQVELPLMDEAELGAAIKEALRDIARSATRPYTGLDGQTEQRQEEMFQSRETEILTRLAARILPFAREVAEAGYQAGIAARESSPEGIVGRAMDALRGE